MISVFIQFSFYIYSIQFLYSFNSIFIFIQFNPSLFIQSFLSLINFGVWVEGKFDRGTGTYSKDGGENGRAGDEDFEVRSFFKPLSFMYVKQVVCCSFEQHSSHPYLYFQVSFKGNQPTDVQSELETTSTDVQSELETTFNGKEK